MAFASIASLDSKTVFGSLLSLVPINLSFNILVCPPALIIPLGGADGLSVKSTATLLKQDKVTSEDQVSTSTTKTEETLVVTQRAGQQYIINTTVPTSNFLTLSGTSFGISSTGILQTMINIMYNNFETKSCILISEFGVAGIDGNLYIQMTEVASEKGATTTNMMFRLAVQPPEAKKETSGNTLNPVNDSTQKEIDGFMP